MAVQLCVGCMYTTSLLQQFSTAAEHVTNTATELVVISRKSYHVYQCILQGSVMLSQIFVAVDHCLPMDPVWPGPPDCLPEGHDGGRSSSMYCSKYTIILPYTCQLVLHVHVAGSGAAPQHGSPCKTEARLPSVPPPPLSTDWTRTASCCQL